MIQLEYHVQARGFVESLATGSCNSADAGLVRSVLAAGFYPLVRANPTLDSGEAHASHHALQLGNSDDAPTVLT